MLQEDFFDYYYVWPEPGKEGVKGGTSLTKSTEDDDYIGIITCSHPSPKKWYLYLEERTYKDGKPDDKLIPAYKRLCDLLQIEIEIDK